MVPENQINLTAGGVEIAGEEFHAQRFEMYFRRALAQFAAPQMLRLRLADEARFELCKEVHRL